jgi:CRP-like cAMP-binding protein
MAITTALASAANDNPLITRLRTQTGLTATDISSLGALCANVRSVAPHADIVKEGAVSDHLHVILSGWACRYKVLADGRRQIAALLLPGDICDLDGFLVERLDYSIGALTRCMVAPLPHDQLHAMADASPALRDVFWWLTFVDNAIATEWSVCLGRRSARERLAHLFCEIFVRLDAVGHADENSYPLPITQEEMSDALGLSTVHVNRVLQGLRADGLVNVERQRLTLLDWEGITTASGFSPDYLHLEGPRFRPSRTMAPAHF